jgi:hypothetical protein
MVQRPLVVDAPVVPQDEPPAEPVAQVAPDNGTSQEKPKKLPVDELKLLAEMRKLFEKFATPAAKKRAFEYLKSWVEESFADAP